MSQIEEPNKEFSGPAHLSDLDRRDFMKYMGLFSTMTFLSSCSRPAQNILPMPKEFEEYSQRSYEYYTTAISAAGFAQGIKVKCFEGRPIKVEGNTHHPYSLGATTAVAQSLLYDLYHPGRNQKIKHHGKERSIEDLPSLIKELTTSWKDGQGVYVVFPAIHSPIMTDLIRRIQKKYPKSHWVSLSPYKETSWNDLPKMDQDFVISFDVDAFTQRPDALKNAREFMERREKAIAQNNKSLMNELLVLESSPTLMGAKADQKLTLTREEIWNDAVDLYHLLDGKAVTNKRMKDLLQRIQNRSTLVLIDPTLNPKARALEFSLNKRLKTNLGHHSFPLPETISRENFIDDTKTGLTKTLLTLDSDILYWLPELQSYYKKIPERLSLSLFPDTTFEAATTKIALAHTMESWGDLMALDGSITIQQPMIRPIYSSISLNDFLLQLSGETGSIQPHIFMNYKDWVGSLQKGIIPGPPKISSPEHDGFQKRPLSDGFNLKVVPDPTIGYGENANNPILQELPKPFSKLTWSNAIYLSPEEAQALKVKNGDMVKVKSPTFEMKGPVWVLPGVARETVVMTLGYGQESGTFVGKNRGYYAYGFHQDEPVRIEKSWGHTKLASTHGFQELPHHHPPIKEGKLPLTKTPKIKLASLYPENPIPKQEDGPQWGMTIDLTTCIGCQSCVSACQVENNVPFVGEAQVKQDRILHWLRVDTYFVDDKAMFQPVPCMHCEKAPCEVVCPVNATVHGNGGLNQMVYNRCVGTRYCSNNCPYKVRRFNFKAYSSIKQPWNMGLNPEVSVRERGVMEKCTYCIQRIKTGENKTACQTVCPTNAITFGDIKDPAAAVSQKKQLPHNYDLLEDEGTVPRTSYLKVVRYES